MMEMITKPSTAPPSLGRGPIPRGLSPLAEAVPPELDGLLSGDERADPEEAWAAFVGAHSRLLFHAARSLGGDHDAVMNRYTYVLEQLRSDDYRRLRGYEAEPACRFTTWLVLVARRLCIDYDRKLYGRARATSEETSGPHPSVRRRLVEGLWEAIDPTSLPASSSNDPERSTYLAECQAALLAALDGLEPEDRLLLKLRLQDELTAREIADLMDFPTQFHVYRRVNALCSTLRRELRARGIVAPT